MVGAPDAGLLPGAVLQWAQAFLPVAIALCLCTSVYADSHERPDTAYPGPVVPEYEKEPQPSSGFERIFSDTTDAGSPEQAAEPSSESDSIVSDTTSAEPPEQEAEPQPSNESDSVVSDIAYPGPVAPEYEKEPQPSSESDSIVSDTASAEPLEQEAEPQPLTESDSIVSDTTNEGSPGQEETPQLSVGLDSIFTDEGQTADVASLENAVTRFRSVRMGIELSLAECEELSLCSPPVNGEELDTLIQLLDGHVDMLSRLREDAESPREFDELLLAYSSEKGSMEGLAGDLEGLGELPVAVPDFELPDTDAIEAELTETLLEFEDTDEELLDDESDESFEDFGDELPAE